MTSSEAARKHWLELKDKPFKQKVEHIVTYYGVVLLLLLGLVVVAVSYTIHVLSLKDSVLNVTCMGATVTQKSVDEYIEGFVDQIGIDTDQYEVNISTNLSGYKDDGSAGAYDVAEIMLAMAAAKAIDVIISDSDTLIPYMYQNLFADPNDVLTAQQVEQYKDYFLYADRTIVEQLSDMTVVEELPEFPDPTKPELMDDPVAIAIRIPEEFKFHQVCFPAMDNYVVFGILINAVNVDNTLAFLDYVME